MRSIRILSLALLAACTVFDLAALAALAAPLPRLRGASAGQPALAGTRAVFAPAPADGGLGAACGTNLDAIAEQVAAHAERLDDTPLPTPHSRDADGIAVLEDDGTFWYANSGGKQLLDVAAATRAFYRTHGDDYDFVAFYLASGKNQWLGSPGALAAAWPIRNDTQGIGLPAFDVGASFGSAARLQVPMTMNGLQRYPADPDAPIGGPGDTFTTMDVLAHEFGHRWLAYTFVDSAGTASPALLGRDYQHWGFFFDADSSYMEGCDWTIVRPDSFVTSGVSATYGALDQYLMGLRTHAEMDSFFTVNAPTDFNPPGTYIPISNPQVGVGCRGRATMWTLANVEAVNGVRVPDGSVAPHQWRIAFALIVPRGTDATAEDLAKLGVIRTRFPRTMIESTGGRGSVDVSLDSRAGSVVIAHTPLPDTEDGATPRAIGANVTIAQAGIPLTVNPASVMLHWRAGTSGPGNDVPMTSAGADSFVAAIPAGGTGVIQYWLSAASDSAGIAVQLPPAGDAAPFQYTVGADLTPPVILHTPVSAQSRDRLPQTLLARIRDNLGLDSLWMESSVNGGPIARAPLTHVGHDSFTVALGAGAATGQRVAYRFVARDAAAAHNLGYSNPAFDTLRVIHDWVDEFENPANWFHQNVLFSWRDGWNPDTSQSSPAGGTSLHCGSTEGLAYAPHVDAALYSPFIYDVVAGTTIAFDERHDLEQEDAAKAYDGARIELSNGSAGAWQPVAPSPGYTHTMDESGMPFAAGSACWSGNSGGWVRRTIDLSPYAPGPLRIRVRMCSDDFLGYGGMWIDHVSVHYPDESSLGVPSAPLAAFAGTPWPNPARDAMRLPLTLPRQARIEWALLDVQGRVVAPLFSGALAAGTHELAGMVPRSLAPGLYFTRVRMDGRSLGTSRVAIVR